MSGLICMPAVNPDAREKTFFTPVETAARPAVAKVEVFKNLMPVQWVNRPHLDFRGFAGTIASGAVKPGDEIAVLPSGQTTRIKALIGAQGEIDRAEAGDSVTITLADEVDVARGDMLAASRERPQVADQFAAHLVWMSSDRLLPERSYLMKINNATLAATVTGLKHQIDVNSFAQLAAKTLALNEIGVCNLSLSRPVAFDPEGFFC